MEKQRILLICILCLFSLSLLFPEENDIQKNIRIQEGDPYWIVKAIFNSDDTGIILGATKGKWISGSIITVLDTTSPSVLEFKDPSHLMYDLAVSPDNTYIVSGGARGRDPVFEGEISMWTFDGNVTKFIDPETYAGYTFIKNIDINSRGNTYCIGGNAKTVKLIDKNGTIIRTFNGYSPWEDPVYSGYNVDISPDNTYILVQTDYSTQVWSYDGVRDHVIPGAENAIFSPRFTPDGLSVVYITRDTDPGSKTWIKFWDHKTMQKGSAFEILPGDEYPVSSPVFTHDSSLFAIVMNTGIKLFSKTDGTLVKTIKVMLSQHPALSNNTDFPDTTDASVETDTATLSGTMTIPVISTPAFSRNGDYFLFCHPDKQKAEIIHLPSGSRLFISPTHEGNCIVYNTLNQYDCPGKNGPFLPGNTGKTRYTPGLLTDFFKER